MADSRIYTEGKELSGKNVPKQAVGHQPVPKLRREKLSLRCSLTDVERTLKCARIREKLTQCEAWKHAESILVYASYGTEVSTWELIDLALLEGKRVFCPKVEGKKMEFFRILSASDLKPGFRGILEPDGQTESFERHEREGQTRGHQLLKQRVSAGSLQREYKRALLLAPGTAFDPEGNRIGYGGGYYDRYLGQFAESDRPYCIGLCFSCQLTEKIAAQKHDVPMDMVIYA